MASLSHPMALFQYGLRFGYSPCPLGKWLYPNTVKCLTTFTPLKFIGHINIDCCEYCVCSISVFTINIHILQRGCIAFEVHHFRHWQYNTSHLPISVLNTQYSVRLNWPRPALSDQNNFEWYPPSKDVYIFLFEIGFHILQHFHVPCVRRTTVTRFLHKSWSAHYFAQGRVLVRQE